MAQGKIIVTTAELETAAHSISLLADTYHENYEKIFTLVNDLKEASWQGNDNLVFTNQIMQFRNDFENMEHILRDYESFLKKTAEGYRTTQGYIKDGAAKLENSI